MLARFVLGAHIITRLQAPAYRHAHARHTAERDEGKVGTGAPTNAGAMSLRDKATAKGGESIYTIEMDLLLEWNHLVEVFPWRVVEWAMECFVFNFVRHGTSSQMAQHNTICLYSCWWVFHRVGDCIYLVKTTNFIECGCVEKKTRSRCDGGDCFKNNTTFRVCTL